MGFIGRDDELTEKELVLPDELECPGAPAEAPAQPVPQEVPA